MLAFLARIAEMHVDPTISDPRKIEQLPDDARTEDEGRPSWPRDDMKGPVNGRWMGLQQDVGIFSEKEWNFIMCKCVASMGYARAPLPPVPDAAPAALPSYN